MNALEPTLWTIEELAAQVALALSVDYEGPGDGRTREVPDLRTIRYYTTLGLIDRPAAMRGRTALYGQRHLLQLVAIKRLQSKGLTLGELQQRLVGLTDTELAEVARLPVVPQTKKSPARSESFWTARPAAPEPTPPRRETPDLPLQAVHLEQGLLLLLPAARPVDADDVEAIRAAAAPLCKLLEKRRLLANRKEPTDE
jgi:DNA-binding transcriptional MerR regulator